MQKFVDAFGRGLWDHLQGKNDFEIIERDDGLVEVAPIERYFDKGLKSLLGSKTARQALRHARAKALDVGCGAGRHCLYLQEKGIDVLGIDISPLAVKTSKARGVREARVASVDDVKKFRPGSFGSIIMMGNNFGLFGSPAKAKRYLKEFYKATDEQGVVIAETRNPYATDNPDHLRYHQLNKRRGRWSGQLRLRVRYKRLVENWFDYLFVSPKELAMIVKGTGWHVQKLIGDTQADYVMILTKEHTK